MMDVGIGMVIGTVITGPLLALAIVGWWPGAVILAALVVLVSVWLWRSHVAVKVHRARVHAHKRQQGWGRPGASR